MKFPHRLAITLTHSDNERRLWIEVKGDSQEDALKDKDLASLTKSGWKIKEYEKIVLPQEVLAFVLSKKEKGATREEMMAEFGVKSTNVSIITDKLRLGHACFDGPYGDDFIEGDQIEYVSRGTSLVYIVSRFSEKKAPKKEAAVAVAAGGGKPLVITNEPEPVEIPEMSKAEGKRQRKSIIAKATKDQIIGDSFRTEFLTSLTDLERQYLKELDQFKTRLMLTEIRKKG